MKSSTLPLTFHGTANFLHSKIIVAENKKIFMRGTIVDYGMEIYKGKLKSKRRCTPAPPHQATNHPKKRHMFNSISFNFLME
jgi:hypothetical protein